MDYTTSVFPVTVVDPQIDIPVEPHEFYNHEDEAIYKLCELDMSLSNTVWADHYFSDNTNLFSGCPVGLQLIGRTLEEEAVLRMTFIVDTALKEMEARA